MHVLSLGCWVIVSFSPSPTVCVLVHFFLWEKQQPLNWSLCPQYQTLQSIIFILSRIIFNYPSLSIFFFFFSGWLSKHSCVQDASFPGLADLAENMQPISLFHNWHFHKTELLMFRNIFPILWSPNVKNWFIGKDPNAGKDWRQKEKGVAKDEIDSITNSMGMSLS